MISQNKIKLINSLSKKKYRDQHQLFIAEGEKLVFDLFNSAIKVEELFVRSDWQGIANLPQNIKYTATSEQYLKKTTQLKTPPPILAICRLPQPKPNTLNLKNSLILALDEVQDPGNLGTIIRLADWFGIETIVCSTNTADAYNPKVVQATMGAIARVNVYHTNLEVF